MANMKVKAMAALSNPMTPSQPAPPVVDSPKAMAATNDKKAAPRKSLDPVVSIRASRLLRHVHHEPQREEQRTEEVPIQRMRGDDLAIRRTPTHIAEGRDDGEPDADEQEQQEHARDRIEHRVEGGGVLADHRQ